MHVGSSPLKFQSILSIHLIIRLTLSTLLEILTFLPVICETNIVWGMSGQISSGLGVQMILDSAHHIQF